MAVVTRVSNGKNVKYSSNVVKSPNNLRKVLRRSLILNKKEKQLKEKALEAKELEAKARELEAKELEAKARELEAKELKHKT